MDLAGIDRGEPISSSTLGETSDADWRLAKVSDRVFSVASRWHGTWTVDIAEGAVRYVEDDLGKDMGVSTRGEGACATTPPAPLKLGTGHK
jgi:hypothetical protein